MPHVLCQSCGKKINRRTAKLNGGLCNKCLRENLIEIARKQGKKK
jgi:NMD protein affecting ribosome stability and mRNA decay